MSALLWVDGLYADFCATMSGPLRDEARRLSFTLGLAPAPFIPWSRVFASEVTLAAPWMFAEVMPGAPAAAAREALFAHVLAVVEAMGKDRIEDGQVASTPALLRVLAAARAARDEHLTLAAGPDAAASALALAARSDDELEAALQMERALLLGRGRVDFLLYESVSERKQAPGLVATVVLAERAGWEERRVAAVRRVLLDVALALQFHDDVIDWEEDAAHGRAWALALARRVAQAERSRSGDAATRADPATVRASGAERSAARAEVHAGGVLARVLHGARLRFQSAARRAAELGAARLAGWAAEREDALERLAEREGRHAGYVHRARALAPWARAVLGPKP